VGIEKPWDFPRSSEEAEPINLSKFKWAAGRLLFVAAGLFSLVTLVGGYLCFPYFSYCFFGTWRFWKYFGSLQRMLFYSYSMTLATMRGKFKVSVPLFEPPMTAPDRSLVRIRRSWQYGEGCADCGNCCVLIKCPLRDEADSICLAYDSFYWRYFNCGRFPTKQEEIEHYNCPKWKMA
jgi:hypothetical protein